MENQNTRSQRLVTVPAKQGGECYMVVDFRVTDNAYRALRAYHRDWKAGRLTEDQIAFQVDCYPVGGGFSYSFPLSKIIAFDATLPESMTRAVFGFDSIYESRDALHFVGYHNPHRRWNGWAVPYLPVESAEEFCRQWEKEFGDHAREFPDDTIFVEYRDGKLHFDERAWGEDGKYAIEAETIHVDGQPVEAFNLGGSYTWNDLTFEEWEKIHGQDEEPDLSDDTPVGVDMAVDPDRI